MFILNHYYLRKLTKNWMNYSLLKALIYFFNWIPYNLNFQKNIFLQSFSLNSMIFQFLLDI